MLGLGFEKDVGVQDGAEGITFMVDIDCNQMNIFFNI